MCWWTDDSSLGLCRAPALHVAASSGSQKSESVPQTQGCVLIVQHACGRPEHPGGPQCCAGPPSRGVHPRAGQDVPVPPQLPAVRGPEPLGGRGRPQVCLSCPLHPWSSSEICHAADSLHQCTFLQHVPCSAKTCISEDLMVTCEADTFWVLQGPATQLPQPLHSCQHRPPHVPGLEADCRSAHHGHSPSACQLALVCEVLWDICINAALWLCDTTCASACTVSLPCDVRQPSPAPLPDAFHCCHN